MNRSMQISGMQKWKNKISALLKDDMTGTQMYLLALAVFLFGDTLTTTMFQASGRLYLICRAVPVLLIIMKVLLFDRYSVRAFWLTLIMLFIGAVVFVKSGYMEPVLWMVMLTGARNVPWKKILQVYILVVSCIVFMAFCASLLEIIENLQYAIVGSTRVRNSFGSMYTTDFASHIFSVCLAAFYLLKERLKIWHYVAAFIIAMLVFRFCNTRLDVGCMLLLIVVFLFLNLQNKKTSAAGKYQHYDGIAGKMAWFMPLMTVIMFAATVLYRSGNSLIASVNTVLSDRLRLGYIGLSRYGFSLLGQQVEMIGNGGSTEISENYFFVDCSYLYVFLRYGALILLIVLGIYILCCKKFRKDSYFLAAIVLVSINCMIAHHLMELTYNPFALALFAAVPENAGLGNMAIRWKGRYAGADRWHESAEESCMQEQRI